MIDNDYKLRHSKVQALMKTQNVDAMLVASNVGLLYLYGQIYSGIAYVPAEGEVQFFVRRPQSQEIREGVLSIRKIEQIVDFVCLDKVSRLALELDELSYTDILRQHKLAPQAELHNATYILREARMVKTPAEIEAIRQTAAAHMAVYQQIPQLYKLGMTEVGFQIEIERAMRLGGSSGIFRTFGSAMEIYMGSLLSGVNAAEPSPYDFALGGSGSSALPLGATERIIQEGTTVMIDMAGNYGVYLSDMTRTYSVGRLPDAAYRLHQLSVDMHRDLVQWARVGLSCTEIYDRAIAQVEAAGAADYFMGASQKAQFVGHGLGLQINELPVLMGRSRDVLLPGMVIAYEPKFVLPDVGAVGVENTYLVTEQGLENLTPLSEEIVDLLA
ncbi:MAG: Xaa-Pro peptidase family protein [Porphyromonadaceae bacterium]|nr:Xaa-Pro peptidase family protein [Porphyromonadaceae bacterium]